MSETMIERVAKAIAQADERNGGPPYDYTIGLGKHAKEALFDRARAAIAAMREPTMNMIDAADYDGGVLPPQRAWPAMIDAALSESMKGE